MVGGDVDGGLEVEVLDEGGKVELVDGVPEEDVVVDGKVVGGPVVPVTSAAESSTEEASCEADELDSAAFCASSWLRAC